MEGGRGTGELQHMEMINKGEFLKAGRYKQGNRSQGERLETACFQKEEGVFLKKGRDYGVRYFWRNKKTVA